MANPLLSYGWTPDSVVAASGGFGGGTNTGALPNSGATLAFGQNVTRSYPAWMNAYGYQGSLANNSAKTFTDPGVDPYSLLPSHAASPDTAPQTASAGGGVANETFAGPELNGEGGKGNGGFPSMSDLGNIPGQVAAGARGFAGAIGDLFGGGGTPGVGTSINSPDQVGSAVGSSASDEHGAPGSPAFARGGLVTRNRLMGPDPRGPDDGYASLNIGEGVLTAAALKHYGKDIVSRLNRLSVPKEKLR